SKVKTTTSPATARPKPRRNCVPASKKRTENTFWPKAAVTTVFSPAPNGENKYSPWSKPLLPKQKKRQPVRPLLLPESKWRCHFRYNEKDVALAASFSYCPYDSRPPYRPHRRGITSDAMHPMRL